MKLGKPLKEWREEANYFSGKASEAIRALSFGGLAIIWLFKQDSGNGPTLDGGFLIPIVLFAFALGFDLFHYVVGSTIWYNFFIKEEKKRNASEEKLVVAPEWKRDVVSFFFYAKITILVIAYIFLFVNLIDKLIQ